MFKIKTGYKLQMLTNETMALLDDGPIVDTNKNGKNVPKLEQVRSVLVHCNVVQNDSFLIMLLVNCFLFNQEY